jgi:hypothetical protein
LSRGAGWIVGQFETNENERKNGDFEAISGRDDAKNVRNGA